MARKITYPFYSTKSACANPLIHKHPDSTRSACHKQIKGTRQIIEGMADRPITPEISLVISNSLKLAEDVVYEQQDSQQLNEEFQDMVKQGQAV